MYISYGAFNNYMAKKQFLVIASYKFMNFTIAG